MRAIVTPWISRFAAAVVSVCTLATCAHAADPSARPYIAQPGGGGPAALAPAAWPPMAPQDDPSRKPGPRWTIGEIGAARNRCGELLRNITTVVIPTSPLRDGICGTPAPVELVSIGRSPQVSFEQPGLVTCALVAAFARWMHEDVQPAARQLLGAPIVRVSVMSHYSCRNAYGRRAGRLSEHGRANALDIRGFVTERGETVEVLADWGQTERDARAQIAAAKAAAAKRQAEAAARRAQTERMREAAAHRADTDLPRAMALSPEPSAPLAGHAPPPAGDDDRPSLRLRSFSPNVPGILLAPSRPAPPSKLGGPKPEKQARKEPATVASGSKRQQFLRRIHAAACKHFGTVLGPEANSAHRDHFHVDMAERTTGNFCE